jgi:hypothetical protein
MVMEQQIKELAFAIWEEEGCLEGKIWSNISAPSKS